MFRQHFKNLDLRIQDFVRFSLVYVFVAYIEIVPNSSEIFMNVAIVIVRM